MAEIEFIDTTLRDGHQSLWGLRLQTGMAMPAAETSRPAAAATSTGLAKAATSGRIENRPARRLRSISAARIPIGKKMIPVITAPRTPGGSA